MAGSSLRRVDDLATDMDPALGVLCRFASHRSRFHLLSPAAARRRLQALGAMLPKAEALMDRVEQQTIPGPGGPLDVRVYTPADLRADPAAVVYFHGGGWVLGDLDGVDA